MNFYIKYMLLGLLICLPFLLYSSYSSLDILSSCDLLPKETWYCNSTLVFISLTSFYLIASLVVGYGIGFIIKTKWKPPIKFAAVLLYLFLVLESVILYKTIKYNIEFTKNWVNNTLQEVLVMLMIDILVFLIGYILGWLYKKISESTIK